MAKRTFALPGINQLSKEQELARSLQKDGQYLVIGGPGTGKSVVALLRCLRHARDGDDYIFLVFNHLLQRASSQLFARKLISQQWQSWFIQTFYKMTRQRIPHKPVDKNGFADLDWQKVLEIIRELDSVDNDTLPHLIIDEGQDMPPQFYQSLTELGFENFYVVADQNQQIEPEKNSLIREIQAILAIDQDKTIELQENYRNTKATAIFARTFYSDPKSPPPNLPTTSGGEIRPVLAEYGGKNGRGFGTIISAILKESDRDPRRLIGVITPNNQVREKYYQAFNTAEVLLDNGKAKIATYANGGKDNLLFDEGGIIVLNGKSCKGLEFDTVFIADINEFCCWPAIEDQQKKLFYVMAARAIDRIVLLKNTNEPSCPVNTIIPNDVNILEIRQ